MNTAKPNVEVDTPVHQQEWPSDFSQTAMGFTISLNDGLKKIKAY